VLFGAELSKLLSSKLEVATCLESSNVAFQACESVVIQRGPLLGVEARKLRKRWTILDTSTPAIGSANPT
jgi:hypothetical protein